MWEKKCTYYIRTFVIMYKYENRVCKYLTYLFRCEIFLISWSFYYMTMSNNNTIICCAINVNGLQMKDKQRRLLQWIKNQKCSIVFLQEMHFNNESRFDYMLVNKYFKSRINWLYRSSKCVLKFLLGFSCNSTK